MSSISMAIYPCSFSYASSSKHIVATRVNLRLPFSFNLNQKRRVLQHVCKPFSAVGSGFETSLKDPNFSGITLKNVEVAVESLEEDKIQIRVDVPGDETEKVFGKIMADLSRQAPPVPGFRRGKGGKTMKVPRDYMLRIFGEDNVTNYVVQEIVLKSVADYVKKENLKVRDDKVTTIQKGGKLKQSFAPGKPFRFTAVLELQNAESTTESESETESQTVTATES